MRALLAAMQARLQEAMAPLMRPGDVFVTPDVDFFPHHAGLPAVGLKDGPILRRELAADMVEETMQVQVVVWVGLLQDMEASVMGDEASGEPGVLAVADAVRAALDADSLELPGVQSGLVVGEAGSEIAGDDQAVVQMKMLTIEYIREVER